MNEWTLPGETTRDIDYLIHGAQVMTDEGWLRPGWVTVANGFVAGAGAGAPKESLRARARRMIDGRCMALLPGLENAHTHLSQTFMRGLAGGRPLLRWLKEVIWPLQAAMTPEETRLAALLGLLENLRCGATRVTDHHKITGSRDHTLALLRAIDAVGLRVTVARAWADRGGGAEPVDALLDEMEGWYEAEAAHPLARFASGPLTPWRCGGAALQKLHDQAARHVSLTHIHVSETQDEVRMTLEETGLRPVAWLHSLGVLDARCEIVHAVWVDEDEMNLLAEQGVKVVHCPVSNAVLGSGIAPVEAMRKRGTRLALGTDGPASNDTQDLFETGKSAIGLARLRELDAAALPPDAALRLMTGGRAVRVGAEADLILVNLNHARAVPAQDVDSALALCCHGTDVEMVMVGGRLLLHEGRVLCLDEPALLAECRRAARSLRERAGLTLAPVDDRPVGPCARKGTRRKVK